MQIPLMPFKILAFAPFASPSSDAWSKSPIPVDRTSLDQVLTDLKLSVYIPLPDTLSPSGGVEIRIAGMKDFHPDRIIQNSDLLNNLMDFRAYIKKAKSQGVPVAEINAEIKNRPGLPHLTPEPETSKPGKSAGSAIDNILDMVDLPDTTTSDGSNASPAPAGHHTLLTQVDMALDQILNHIYADPTFMTLESAWRGLHFLLQRQSKNTAVKIEIIPASADTLADALDHHLPHLVQELPSLIIVDLPLNNTAVSLNHLEKIAGFAETLMVPAICWVSKDFLYLDHWKDINTLPFLPNHLDEAHYAKWHKLEQSSAGTWLSVTCNRLPSRYPYGKDNTPRQVDFSENAHPWISPVWGAAGVIARSFDQTGWPTRFTDIQNVYLEDLPLNTLEQDKPLATETHFTHDRLDQFKRIGIMPLSGVRNKDIAVMPFDITVAGISLQYQLILSRITQFVFWCIDHLGHTGDPAGIASDFKKAFSMFWQNSGFQLPDDMEITTGKPDDENKIPLYISFTPQPGILPVKQKIELGFRV